MSRVKHLHLALNGFICFCKNKLRGLRLLQLNAVNLYNGVQ